MDEVRRLDGDTAGDGRRMRIRGKHNRAHRMAADLPLALPRGLVHSLAAGVFLLAALAAVAAQQSDRPITSAIIFLFGVTLVGALEGLKGGLLAALAASVIYNFFLSDPVYRFSLSSVEEYVPLIAFNLSAAASGLVAGRLRDRALAAELASRRILALFEVSERLQQAVRLDDIPPAVIATAGGRLLEEIEIYVARDGGLEGVGGVSAHLDEARDLLSRRVPAWRFGSRRAFLLQGADSLAGAAVITPVAGGIQPDSETDLEALVSLISMAVERCMLLERLSEAELVKRSEEFKTALLSSVSHDMRTPLSAIAASASSLTRYSDALGEETRSDLLNMIQEQCDRLNRYTSNLLNMGRLQAGLDAGTFTRCDALEALGRAVSNARSLGPRHDVRKVYDLDGAIVRADPVMLEQIFYNVLENSMRYSPEDSPVIVRACADAGTLTVEISDRGCGIAEADRERIFDRFYRSRSAPPREGSGLGLSIAKGFTEAFGGSIGAERADDPEGGTKVTIRLPLDEEEGQP